MTVGETEALAGYAIVLIAVILTTTRQSRLLHHPRIAALAGKRLLQWRLVAESAAHAAYAGALSICLVIASGITFFSSTTRAAAFLALGLIAAIVYAWATRTSRRFLVEMGDRGRVLVDPDIEAEAPRRRATFRLSFAAFVVFAIPWPGPADESVWFWFLARGVALATAVVLALGSIVYLLRFQSAWQYAVSVGHVVPVDPDPPSVP